MFELRILSNQPLIKFDRQLPVFNWHYPFSRPDELLRDQSAAYQSPDRAGALRTALYIHIPFCETICNFCPFQHDKYRAYSDLKDYMSALETEVVLKRRLIGHCGIDAIFVGGGTPSILTPPQILSLGDTLAKNFSLDSLNEFTFEVEVKSVTREKLRAMQRIEVDRISFGAQTFSEYYRKILSLDASARQIFDCAELVNAQFRYTNVDILYGLPGQTLQQLEYDITTVMQLKTTTIDVYPINNLTVPRSMQDAAAREQLEFLPAARRVQFRLQIDDHLRGHGYVPISGYSYALAEAGCDGDGRIIQRSPKFLYHDLIYGYDSDEIIGYGSSSISRMMGFNAFNTGSRKRYVATVLEKGKLPQQCISTGPSPERGIVCFPYRGILDKAAIAWDQIEQETLTSLRTAIDAGLIHDGGDNYVLTKVGWLFYVNLMYHLMPRAGREFISRRIDQQQLLGWRCGSTDLSELLEFNA